jgi:hypothetical protein
LQTVWKEGNDCKPLDEDLHVIKPSVQAMLKVNNEVTVTVSPKARRSLVVPFIQ